MQMFHTTAAFLIMFLLCIQPSTLAAVRVKYSRGPVTKTEDLSLSLTCTVEYKIEDCDIEAKWSYTNSSELLPIVDNNKYLITVNETQLGTDKHRNILLTIGSLKLQDSGFYQCDAICLNSGIEAKGHVVTLNVSADPYKSLKVSTWSGQLKADAATLAFSAILLLLRGYNDAVFSL